jgi:hypothetical protein
VTDRNFAEDLKVSKLTLDLHLEEQSELVGHYGNKVAEARETRDDLKGKLDLKKADKRLYYKCNPPASLPKPTADDLDALVTTDPDVQEATTAYVKACKEHDEWAAAERAIEAKGKALGHLTSLYGASYFATPR